MRKTVKVILTASLFLFPAISFAETYGSNYLVSGTVTCSQSHASYPCTNLVDGNTATSWLTEADTNYPHWIKYDLGSGVTKNFAKIYLRPNGDVAGCGMKNWSLYASNDDSNYSLILATSTMTNCSVPTDVYVTSSPFSPYRYFKVFFADTYRPSNQNYIDEWQAFECTDCGSGSTTSTASSTMGFMSPETDFTIRLFIEALFVIMGLGAGYLLLKKHK